MIKIRNLYKSYNQTKVLENINLDVRRGEVLALVGFSGSGKSTLLKIISGLEKQDRGVVHLESEKFGMCFQYSALFDSMTVQENIAFPLRCKKIDKYLTAEQIKNMVAEKLKLVGLTGSEDFYPSELSGGMKKRISLARAIIDDPEIVLYDEPTAGLDPVASTMIEDIIVKLEQTTNAASIVVTHQKSTIERTADRVAMLYSGSIVWVGTSVELFDKNNPNEYAAQFREGSISGPMLVQL